MPNDEHLKNNSKISPNNIEIRLVSDWPNQDIVELYKAGGWWKENYDPTRIPSMIKGSFVFAIAVDGSTDHAVGMGRVISDGISDAYIQDVVVLKNYRGTGIGKKIVKKLLDYCLEKKLLWIGLIAEDNQSAFYTPLGFNKFSGEPMVFQPEE
jgi:ribosomal protein S18 acetylase RimI-like enzyme